MHPDATRPGSVVPFALAAAIVAAIALGALLAAAQPPWVDEAWFANPALSLLDGRGLGTTIMADTSYASRGMVERTYWQPPGFFLVQAAWYGLVGFSIAQQRLLSLMLVPVLVLVTWRLMRRAGISDAGTGVGVLVIGTAATTAMAAASGRMDMWSATAGWLGLALHGRAMETRRGPDVLLSHVAVVLSGATHPNGVLYLVTLLLWTLVEAPFALRQVILWALPPYLAFAAGWGAYIAQDPSQFRAQFFGNMAEYPSNFPNLAAALWREAHDRYWRMFGPSPRRGSGFALVSGALKGLVLAALLGGLASLPWRRRAGAALHHRRMLLLVVAPMLGLALLTRNKTPAYFIYVGPAMAMAIAAGFDRLVARRSALAWACAAVVIGAQVIWSVHLALAYRPRAAAYDALRRCLAALPPTVPVYGSAQVAYITGFTPRTRDDILTLGNGPEAPPDRVVVFDRRYASQLQKTESVDPARARRIHEGLSGLPVRQHFGEYAVHSARPLPGCGRAG